MTAKHLSNEEKIKQGSFYTPRWLVDKTYEILKKNKVKASMFVDTSCGYGDFLITNNSIGFDIDEKAVEVVKKRGARAFIANSLQDISKINSKIKKPAVLIGNPPYNNFSSFYKKNQKGAFIGRDKYKSRDLGISFLKSYVDINVEYVCVLHPLSFLIKKSNFELLGEFKKEFILLDSFVFPSSYFDELKNKTPFPIGIFLYKRERANFNYDFIKNFNFKIDGGKIFSFRNLTFVEEFTTKYKNKSIRGNYKNFQTLRDINALSRNATWLKSESSNSIRVKEKDEYIFRSMENLKYAYQKNIENFWVFGNLSPIVSKSKTTRGLETTIDEYVKEFRKALKKEKNE